MLQSHRVCQGRAWWPQHYARMELPLSLYFSTTLSKNTFWIYDPHKATFPLAPLMWVNNILELKRQWKLLSYHSPMLCRIKNITLHMWLHKQIHILAMNVNGQSIMYSWLDLNIFIYISLCVCNMYSRVKCIVHQMRAQLTNSIPLLKLFTNLITFFTVIYFLETCKGLSVDGYWSC